MKLEPFGDVDHNSLDEYYQGEISISGSPIEIDLNFEDEKIEQAQLEQLSKCLLTIEAQIKAAFEAISADWELGDESETAREYLQLHLDQFDAEETSSLFAKSEINKQSFMNAVKLCRIGLYPEDAESYAIFDIQFPEELTDYLMAVTFNEKQELSCISLDS